MTYSRKPCEMSANLLAAIVGGSPDHFVFAESTPDQVDVVGDCVRLVSIQLLPGSQGTPVVDRDGEPAFAVETRVNLSHVNEEALPECVREFVNDFREAMDEVSVPGKESCDASC